MHDCPLSIWIHAQHKFLNSIRANQVKITMVSTITSVVEIKRQKKLVKIGRNYLLNTL